MLLISRRVHEAFLIGSARVEILENRGNQVRFGITAPKGTHVRRTELAPTCTCEKHGACELHGCSCSTAHRVDVGDEVRYWCPIHNATWSRKIGELVEKKKLKEAI